MNWMIDGLHGDLYRTAMGYRTLTPHDEWEIERNLAKRPNLFRRVYATLRKLWLMERPAFHLAGAQLSAKERTVS